MIILHCISHSHCQTSVGFVLHFLEWTSCHCWLCHVQCYCFWRLQENSNSAFSLPQIARGPRVWKVPWIKVHHWYLPSLVKPPVPCVSPQSSTLMGPLSHWDQHVIGLQCEGHRQVKRRWWSNSRDNGTVTDYRWVSDRPWRWWEGARRTYQLCINFSKPSSNLNCFFNIPTERNRTAMRAAALHKHS